MTQTSSWICDICKKEFRRNDTGWDKTFSMDISIPHSYGEDTDYIFDDTCQECRTKIETFLDDLIKD